MEPILIGYFPKSVSHEPRLPGGEEICSVSNCISSGPAGWVDLWRHNDFAVYDSERVAESVVHDAFRIDVQPDPEARPPWKVTLHQDPFPNGQLFAYKLFPVRFHADREEPLDLPASAVEPLSDRYERLGYDAVIQEGGCHLGFGCSPLSCNGRAGSITVNRHCLLDDAAEALRRANEFARGQGQGAEPGAYVAVEVWRRIAPPLDRGACAAASTGIDPGLIRHAAVPVVRARLEAEHAR